MTKATATQTKSLNACTCGCGFPVKGFYKQGHDAKHVSVLLSYVTTGTYTADEAKAQLPSTALQVKFHNALARWNAKQTKKAEKAIAKQEAKVNPAEVKIGRWWYPVVSVAVGTGEVYVAYTAKDGSVKEVVTTEDKLR